MPKSKHRRNNKNRPRPSRTAPQPRNPTPSPPWIPRAGVGLIAVGILVILLGYLPFFNELTNDLPVFGPNWSLVAGFLFLASGFGFLTRWQ